MPRFGGHSLFYWLLLVALLVTGFLLVYGFFPVGWDYYYYYRPLTDEWWSQPLAAMGGDIALRPGVPPWTMLILLPVGLFPLEMGSAMLVFGSMLMLMLSIWLLNQIHRYAPVIILFAVLNLHTAKMLGLGQLDLFALAGLLLAWWAIRKQNPLLVGLGLALMVTKPVNVVLVGLLFLMSIRDWPLKQIGRVFIIPVIVLIVSSLLVGIDWPARYLASFGVTDTELAILIWRGAAQLGLPSWPFIILGLIAAGAFLRLGWRDGMSERTVGIAIATNFVFSPYAQSAHYVLLIPVFAYVARRNRWLALLAWGFTWAPLLRESIGPEAMWVSIFYPAILLIGLWFIPPATVKITAPSPVQSDTATAS